MAFVPNHCKVTQPIVDGRKECGDCKQVLPVSQFWRNNARADRYQHRCKECSKVGVYGWQRGNVKYIAYRQNERLKRFKLTQANYDEMLLKQDGLCAICRQPERARFRGRLKRLAVDHCHKTGRVRGLLCQSCNRGIGYLGDDAERVVAALAYLKECVS